MHAETRVYFPTVRANFYIQFSFYETETPESFQGKST